MNVGAFQGVDLHSQAEPEPEPNPSARRLSYKFQRLRERIRAAIAAGELAGKLPGERSLARQFNVNAKTLSKALTDLAAEGVLERNIGLGTFVRDGDAAPTVPKIMLLTAGEDGMADCLAQHGVAVYAHGDPDDLPPSLLARFDFILIGEEGIADAVVRDLIVRNKTVLTLDRLATPFAAHAVLAHAALAAAQAGRLLADAGHRRVLLVGEDAGDGSRHALTEALPEVHWESARPDQTIAATQDGYTAAVCNGPAVGRQLIDACRAAGVDVPGAFSVAAFGRLRGDPPCSGHFVSDSESSRAIATLIEAGLPQRPLTLWLPGTTADAGTIARPTAPAGVPRLFASPND